jgi:hypothetical protein
MMTLIISGVTPWWVVQVSDRRVTEIETGNLINDETNKATFFGNRVAFGFTGLAHLDGKPTAEWLADKLTGKLNEPLAEVLDYMAENALAATKRIKLPMAKRYLAFSGVGWNQMAKAERLHAVYCRVSNFHNYAGDRIEPQDHFVARIIPYDGGRSSWHSVGIALTDSETKQLHRRFRVCARRTRGPGPTFRLFGELIRHVASRQNGHVVGKELMISVIPKTAAESAQWVIRAPSGYAFGVGATQEEFGKIMNADDPQLDKMMFYGHAAANGSRLIEYAPAVVGTWATIFYFKFSRGCEAEKLFRPTN